MNWRKQVQERQAETKKLETQLRIPCNVEKSLTRGDIARIEQQYVPWLRRRG